MPSLQAHQLVSAILEAAQASGSSAVIVSPLRSHPRQFVIDGERVWIYAWTLTPGGRPHLRNEFRIQMTTVQSPLPLNPDGPTILIGYESDTGVFAGFDLERHRTFTSGSPSVQVDIRTLRAALQDGFGFDRKGNDEIVVGFRPDQLINYIRSAQRLHRFGSASGVQLLQQAASLSTAAYPTETAPAPRNILVQEIRRYARDANFRQKVLDAYEHRCAVTRLQLRLLDAAHILPVGAPGSIDEACNGMALSPTYHRAYDSQLIYLDKNYFMRINPGKEAELTQLGLVGGLDSFKAPLGRIHLPQDHGQRPSATMIRKANQFRLTPS